MAGEGWLVARMRAVSTAQHTTQQRSAAQRVTRQSASQQHCARPRPVLPQCARTPVQLAVASRCEGRRFSSTAMRLCGEPRGKTNSDCGHADTRTDRGGRCSVDVVVVVAAAVGAVVCSKGNQPVFRRNCARLQPEPCDDKSVARHHPVRGYGRRIRGIG